MTTRIVVLGGGLTGLEAAAELAEAGFAVDERGHQCISLGRRDGLIQFVREDDSPREAILTGRAAALYKEAIVRGTVVFENHPTIPASL